MDVPIGKQSIKIMKNNFYDTKGVKITKGHVFLGIYFEIQKIVTLKYCEKHQLWTLLESGIGGLNGWNVLLYRFLTEFGSKI